MEFCSKYGFDYGFQGSDSEEISDEEGDTQVKTTRRFRRADTNILSVKFDSLVRSKDAYNTSKPVFCINCQACVSDLSWPKINREAKTWTCEFCEIDNILDKDWNYETQIDDVTYLLEATPLRLMTTGN